MFIKSINLLDFLSESDKELLEKRAELHQRYSNIEFKVLEFKNKKLVLRVTQGKSHSENYFDNKRLSEIGKELFQGIELPEGAMVITRPIPFEVGPTNVVTAKWVHDQFTRTGISLVQAGKDLGIDANTLSAFRSGAKPLSGVTKAALFYYFSSK